MQALLAVILLLFDEAVASGCGSAGVGDVATRRTENVWDERTGRLM